jgi:hypothetical protein
MSSRPAAITSNTASATASRTCHFAGHPQSPGVRLPHRLRSGRGPVAPRQIQGQFTRPVLQQPRRHHNFPDLFRLARSRADPRLHQATTQTALSHETLSSPNEPRRQLANMHRQISPGCQNENCCQAEEPVGFRAFDIVGSEQSPFTLVEKLLRLLPRSRMGNSPSQDAARSPASY